MSLGKGPSDAIAKNLIRRGRDCPVGQIATQRQQDGLWSTFVLYDDSMPLPNRDEQHLDRLRDHFSKFGALPSYAGLCTVVGFKAKTAAVKLARRLTQAGYLRQAPGGKLAPTERFFERPRLDVPVKAGSPTSIEGHHASDWLALDSYLVDVPSRTVLIPVKGDSMQDAGVLEGDLVVVERTRTARHGQFVIAMVDGEFTLKELRFEEGRPVLISHNARYQPIKPKQDFEVFGVVRSLIRRYEWSNGSGHRTTRGASE